jgi:hypothetical protein
MTFLFVLLGIGLIAGAAVVITGRYAPNWGVPNSGDYRPDTGAEPLFDVAIRGYRMDEVDAKIAELTAKLSESEKDKRKGSAHDES